MTPRPLAGEVAPVAVGDPAEDPASAAPRPLAGTRVVVTRSEGVGGPLTAALRRRGAQVVHWPAVRFAPPADPAPLGAALERLERYRFVAFTSRRAVAAVVERHPAPPRHARVAAVGRATAEALTAAGWPVHLLPAAAGGAALAAALAPEASAGPVLFPASSEARRELPAALAAAGVAVDEVEAYRTLPADLDAAACLAELPGLAAITFASPSAVDGLAGALGAVGLARLAAAVPAVALGATTAGALTAAGFPSPAIAPSTTLEGLADAVAALVARRTP